MKNREYYLNKFVKYWKEQEAEYIKEVGNSDQWEFDDSDITVDEIVGYYIAHYPNEELKTWNENLSYCDAKTREEFRNSDEKVTKILIKINELDKRETLFNRKR